VAGVVSGAFLLLLCSLYSAFVLLLAALLVLLLPRIGTVLLLALYH
jgi:hypothetical protein